MRLHAVAMAGALLLATSACADASGSATASPATSTPPGGTHLSDTSSGGTPTTGPVVGSDGRGTSGLGEFTR